MKKLSNSLITIDVYKHGKLWVFDDERVDLVKEPFVAGADTLIDKISQGQDRLSLVFGTKPFPGHKYTIERTALQNAGGYGTDYYCPELEHELWLCPALNLYYPESPQTLYVSVVL